MTATTSPGDATSTDATTPAAPSADPCRPPNLRLRDRPFDWFFIVVFSLFTVTSMISDMVPTLGIEPTFRIFGSAVVALALATALGTRHRSIAAAAA